VYFKANLSLIDFQAMEAIERQYYSTDFIAPADIAFTWYLHWPNSVVAAYESDQLVGFMNLFPICETLYMQILDGTFNDARLTKHDILIPITQEAGPHPVYALFLSCVAIDKHHLNRCIARKLLCTYLEIYNSYEQDGCIFDKIITDNITESLLKFSKAMGLKPIRQSDHDSWICTGTYESLKRNLSHK
jgi:hypothetical protein